MPTSARRWPSTACTLDAPVRRAARSAGAHRPGRAAGDRGHGRDARRRQPSTWPCSRATASAACCPPTNLLSLDARSPIALRHAVLGAHDEDALVRAAAQIPKLFLLLARAGVPPRDLGRVLSLQHDTVVARLIDFSISRRGPAPVAWTWLDLGSAARREFTLASDQDNALAYADPEPGARRRDRRVFRPARRRRQQRARRGAASASTTTACWPATASGGCPRPTG